MEVWFGSVGGWIEPRVEEQVAGAGREDGPELGGGSALS